MSHHRSQVPIRETFEQFLRDKGKGEGETGNYRRNAEGQLEEFGKWASGKIADPANADPPKSWTGLAQEGAVTFEDLDTTAFSAYIRYLRSRGLADSTIQTYYAYISSWSKWSTREGYLDSHYARQSDAIRNLEEPTERTQQQAWTQSHRDQLTRYVDEVADAALDAYDDVEVPDGEWGDLSSDLWQQRQTLRFRAIKAVRKRAFVYLLAYTGLRGAEFLRDRSDDRDGRRGIQWTDINFDDGSLSVFRKKQNWEEAALPDPVIQPLQNYQQRLSPPDEWPVFTTLHRPTLATHTTNCLEADGYTESEIAELRGAKTDFLILADNDYEPPRALSTDGGRNIMRSLTESAGIDIDPESGGADYLQLHGARRGMGEVMVREFGFAAAARYLDNSEEQVREAYQHIEAAERASQATKAIQNTDNRQSEGVD